MGPRFSISNLISPVQHHFFISSGVEEPPKLTSRYSLITLRLKFFKGVGLPPRMKILWGFPNRHSSPWSISKVSRKKPRTWYILQGPTRIPQDRPAWTPFRAQNSRGKQWITRLITLIRWRTMIRLSKSSRHLTRRWLSRKRTREGSLHQCH